MAIINSYPNITPKAEDLLLISDTSVEGNPTKTATINNVLALLPSGGSGGGIANIQSSNSNFLSVTNPDGPLVTLNIQTGFVASGGNTLATTGDIYTFTNTSITNAINNLGALTSFACNISNIPAFTSNVTTSTAGATVLTISRTGGQPGEFLDYTGNWSAPVVQGMTSWKLTADSGGIDSITQAETVDIEGDSTKISTQLRNLNPGEYTITVSHDTQTPTNTTPSTTLTNGGTFTALSENVGVDGTGHVTGQVLRTYTLPSNTINSISVDAPIQNTGTASDPIIDIPKADGITATDGYLSSTDWTTFNNKQDALTLTTTGTSGAATLVGSTLNIPIYPSGTGGGTVTGVGLDVSAFNALSVTTQGGGPNPITGSDTFVVGINGSSGATEYLDGSGNWSTPAGTGTNLSNVIGTSNVQIISSSGTNTDVPAVTTTTAGAMTAADKLRLNRLIITTSSETALGPSPINTSSNTLTLPWNGSSSQVVLGDGSLTTLPTQFSWTLDGDTGSNPVSDGATIEIVGGTGISTAVSGNTLTVTNTSSGTVQSIGVQDGNFTTGSTSTGSAITTSGDISFDLSALGNANSASFLRGDDKWSTLTNGSGVAALTNSAVGSTYETTIGLDYTTSSNFIKSAASVTSVSPTDTIIINDATDDNVKEVEVTKIFVKGSTAAPLYFSVNRIGNLENSGNIASDTQGFGTTITTALNSGAGSIKITFNGRASTSTDYMVNFTIEEPYNSGGTDYPINAWIPSSTKTATDFIILYDKGGLGSGAGVPQLTNFIIYD